MNYSNMSKVCSFSVMDNQSDPNIVFDNEGICNYVHEYRAFEKLQPSSDVRQANLERKLEEIKANGQGKPYDCLIGLSGGTDSTYVAWLCKQWGLRPLAVHLDNGWDAELAVKNIENTVNGIGCDLHTLVVNWEEFVALQRAYIRAGVIDIEVVSDHAIFATMYKLAKQYNIKYVLSGVNYKSEFISPEAWIYPKMDLGNILDIYKKHGEGVPLKTYPTFGFFKAIYYWSFYKLQSIDVLNYIDYDVNDAKLTIQREFNWKDYGGKHYESLFTKFYQGYILPTKFKVDKRKAHYSTLICSGQLTRDEALLKLTSPPYPSDDLIKEKPYVVKKLGFSMEEFERIMASEPVPHSSFASDIPMKRKYMNFLEKTHGLRKVLRSI